MTEPADPLCKHEKVIRHDTPNESWNCEWCGAKFYHLEDIGFPGQTIQIMEPTPTLRDKFAMAVLTGMLASYTDRDWRVISKEQIAKSAFRITDAIMEARK
jgi:hypothetical protein